jgi:hypothetical protein
MDLKKSVVKSVVSKDMFNDLYKFEVSMQDGTNGMMYKKSDNPFIKEGDDVVFTVNTKGTIKIIPKGAAVLQENTPYTPNTASFKPSTDKDNLILLQTMFKCSAEYHAHRQTSKPGDVADTAQVWYETAKIIIDDKPVTPKAPVVIEKTPVAVTSDMPF